MKGNPMILICGDTHGDRGRIETLLDETVKNRNIDIETAYILVCGDFGFLFRNTPSEMEYLQELNRKLRLFNCFVLFADGNHENHDYLDSLPVHDSFGGKVHAITSNILHLMRGQAYEIDHKQIFVFGGAASTDKAFRMSYESLNQAKIWWEREIPDNKEYHTAASTMQANRNCFDIIISHTAPREIIRMMGYYPTQDDLELTGFLEWIAHECKYGLWCFGHFHEDWAMGKFRCLMNTIVVI